MSHALSYWAESIYEHRILIGMSFGLWLGHSNTWTCFDLNRSFVALTVCLVSWWKESLYLLSSWCTAAVFVFLHTKSFVCRKSLTTKSWFKLHTFVPELYAEFFGLHDATWSLRFSNIPLFFHTETKLLTAGFCLVSRWLLNTISWILFEGIRVKNC